MKKNNLKNYSAFAALLLIHNEFELSSQVIYSDLDPDVLLEFDYDNLLINMDANESFDFLLLKTSGTWYTSYFETYFLHQDFAGPYYESNQIAGRLVTHGAGGASTYLAYKLQYGELIDESQITFYNAPGQQLASLAGNGIGIGYFAHDTTDGYLAVKFIDEASCYHYGWIRLAVVDSCRKMIIKDYAYELECDHPIIAGSSEHYVPIEEGTRPGGNISLYSFAGDIYIQVPAESAGEFDLNIYTLEGIKALSSKITNITTKITLQQPEGIYIVELINHEKRLVKTLFICR